jgi:hypothetical protein
MAVAFVTEGTGERLEVEEGADRWARHVSRTREGGAAEAGRLGWAAAQRRSAGERNGGLAGNRLAGRNGGK